MGQAKKSPPEIGRFFVQSVRLTRHCLKIRYFTIPLYVRLPVSNFFSQIHISKKNARRLAGVLLGLLLVAGLDFAFPFRPQVPYSTQILSADGSVLHAFLSRDDKWRMQTELAEITPLLQKTLIQKEDRFFLYHPGVNPLALGRAALRNLLSGRRTSGASTITMQVVRLLQPRQRTYGSKLVEMLRAYRQPGSPRGSTELVPLLQGVPELGKLCLCHPLVRMDVNARLGVPGCELGGHGC